MKRTSGPWRWEFNEKSKIVLLCGGCGYDLTVIDFVRWGMSGAGVRFREDADGLNIMNPAGSYATAVPGREHHSSWFKGINHPDANLIAASPEILSALTHAVESARGDESWYEEAVIAIRKAK